MPRAAAPAPAPAPVRQAPAAPAEPTGFAALSALDAESEAVTCGPPSPPLPGPLVTHPSVRSKWKAEQAVRLQAIDAENLKADEAIKAAAKTELEAIVAEVTKAQESRAAANKEAEAAWVEQRDNPKPGSE